MPKCKIILLEAGVVALDEQDRVIRSVRFGSSMVESYRGVKSGTAPSGLLEMLQALKSKGYTSATTNDEALAGIMNGQGVDASLFESEEKAALQQEKVGIMLSTNLASSEAEALDLLRKFAIGISSAKIGEVSGKRDLHVIQTVNAVDEADQIINTMGSRLREWYGLHFPELDGMLQSLLPYVEVVGIGAREDITIDALKHAGLQDRADTIMKAARSSKGGSITTENVVAAQRIADEIRHLDSVRDDLTRHLEQEMDVVAPNVKAVLGATIGARMIARVGGLERLAMLASSTIQVIGAEKALFRSLKTGTRPPKHGIIFQHQLVHSAPRWQRGKIARAIASKVALAARVDAYRGTKDESIMTKLNERIEEIRQKYKEPPEGEERQEPFQEKFEGRREVFVERRERGQRSGGGRFREGERRGRFGGGGRFRERRERFGGREDRFGGGGRFRERSGESGEREDRFGGERKEGFGERRERFGERKDRFREGGGQFRKRSGPRFGGGGEQRGGFGERRGGFGERRPFGERKEFGERRPFGERKEGFGERKEGFGERKEGFGERKDRFREGGGQFRKRSGPRFGGGGERRGGFGERRPFGERKEGFGERRPFGERKEGFGERKEGFGGREDRFGGGGQFRKRSGPRFRSRKVVGEKRGEGEWKGRRRSFGRRRR